MGIDSVITCSMVALVGACVSASGEPQDSTRGPLEGKLSNNGLVLSLANLDYLSTSALGTPTSNNSFKLDETAHGPLLAQTGGKELLSYLITCALGETQEIQIGEAIYTGNLGLATDWVQGPCDHSCQRWVSSCILAHANFEGASVTISPRGSHQGLSWDSNIEEGFPDLEAAYFGNFFEPVGQRQMFACSSLGSPGDLNEALMVGRICGIGACEFEYLGPCDSLGDNAFNIGVCNGYHDGYYTGCGTQSVVLQEPGEPLFEEVITVYLPETP